MENGLRIAWNTVLEMVDGFYAILPNLLIAAALFCILCLLSGHIGRMITTMAIKTKVDRTLAHAIGKIVTVFTNVFGLLVCSVIVVPSFSPDKLIAGLGITSVAIGFAFQNILQNFFAGMLLLWQKPFGIGDEIKARDYEGTVEDITIRTTVLRTYTGQRVFIPNGMLFTDPVIVNTAYANRKIHLEFPLEKEMPIREAAEATREALRKVSSIAKEPEPEVYVSASSGHPVLDIYVWSTSSNSSMIKASDETSCAVQESLQSIKAKAA